MTALKPKRIDLCQSFFEKPRVTPQQKRRIAAVLFPILLVVVIAGGYGFFRMEIAMLQQQLLPIETYLNTPDTQDLHQKADRLQLQDNRLTALAKTMQDVAAAVDSYPHLGWSMLESVYSLAGDTTVVTELTYDGVTGILGVVIETDLPESGQAYLERLRRTGHFDKLEHVGYAGDIDGVAVYMVEIFATLPSPTKPKD